MSEMDLPPGYGGHDALQRRLAALLACGGREETIGRSREGRPIQAYRWGEETAPALLVMSLLHPMEWIGLEVHLALLEALLGGTETAPIRPGSPVPSRSSAVAADAGTGPPSRAVLSIPVANPDGFARVEASLLGRHRRWVRGNAAGVDLNRNFPIGHRARPAYLSWWPLYRPGPAPLSEPETAAIAAWIRGRPTRCSFSLHSFGRWIYAPPAGAWRPLPRTEEMVRVARVATAGSGYRACALGRWSPFFRAHGTELDFLHAVTGAPAYLVELSGGGAGRWGIRRLAEPFYLFNPPRPEREIARVLPVLRGIAEALAGVP